MTCLRNLEPNRMFNKLSIYKICYIIFIVCLVILSLILYRADKILLIHLVVLIPIAISTDKYPGTYKMTSSISKRYKLLRDIFVTLSFYALLIDLYNEDLIPSTLLWSLVSLCIFFYYQYLQCNKEFVDKKGKYFLLSAGTTIGSTFLLVVTVFDYFWISKIRFPSITSSIGIALAVIAFYFIRKNKTYIIQNSDQ